MSRRHSATPIPVSDAARGRRRREAVFRRVHDAAALTSLVALPIEFVPTPGVGPSLSLMQASLVVAAVAMALTSEFRRWLLRMDLPSAFFLLGNATYLAFMAASCHVRNVDTAATFFLAKGAVFLGAISVALAVRRWVRRAAEAAGEERRYAFGYTPALVAAGAVCLTAFGYFFLLGLRNVGISPVTMLGQFVGGDKRGFIFSMQMAFGSFMYPVPAAIYQGLVPVFKNSVAEALAVIGVLILVLGGTRRLPGRAVGVAASLLAVVSLSRSTTIMVLAAAVLLVPRLRPAVRSMLLVSVVATAMVMGWAYLYSLETAYTDDLSVRRADASVTSRIDQYTRALFAERTPNEWLFGRGANHDIGGHRIHNLVLSSWHEGGLIALAAVLCQYGAVLWRGLNVALRGRRGMALAALCIAGLTRTAVAGAGGYYTAAGAVAVMTFLLIAADAGSEPRAT